MGRAADAASLLCDGPAAIYLLAADGSLTRGAAHRLEPEVWPWLPQRLPANGLPLLRRAIAEGQRQTTSYVISIAEDERALLNAARGAWLVATPLRGRRSILGGLLTVWRRKRPGPLEDLQALDLVAFHAALGVEHARFYAASESERRRLDLILEQIPDSVWIVDAEGRLSRTNSAGRQLLGLGPDDPLPSLGEVSTRIVQRDDEGRSWGKGDLGLAAAAHGKTVRGELYSLSRRSGSSESWFLSSAAPLRDPSGQAIGAVGVTTDITVRRRALDAERLLGAVSATLGGSLDYLDTLAKVARMVVPLLGDWCIIDLVERGGLLRLPVAHADPRRAATADDLQQLAPDGGGVVPLIEAQHEPAIRCDILACALLAAVREPERTRLLGEVAISGCMVLPLVVRRRTIGLMYFVMAESGRRHDDADLPVAADLAYRAALAIDNGRLYHELRDAERRKDEFLAVLSHELRTPLAPLMTWVELLRRAPDLTRARHAADVIERNVRVQRALINELLDLAAITRGKVSLELKPVNVIEALRAAVDTLSGQAREKGIRLECAIADEELLVEGDPTRLHQVFWNLLSNAIKFTPRDGVVSASAERAGDGAVVRIRDTGVGIAPAFLPQVFEMFKQQEEGARRSHGGLGIGLALAKRLTELHRGTIQATSSGLGRGAEFTVWLPLSGEALEPAGLGIPRAEENGRPLQDLTVLLVEDAPDTREAMQVMFEQLGAQVVCAEHGGDALEKLGGSAPDLILCDLRMPVMDGYELIRHLRNDPRHANLPVVAVSGFASEESFRKAQEAGFDAYVSKPFEYEALVSSVQQAIAGRPRHRRQGVSA
jgi:PAS domain S-box-containing protein